MAFLALANSWLAFVLMITSFFQSALLLISFFIMNLLFDLSVVLLCFACVWIASELTA